jgi:hypothetical protein
LLTVRNRLKIAICLLAVICASLAAFAYRKAAEMVDVLAIPVMKRDVARGQVIRDDDVTSVEVGKRNIGTLGIHMRSDGVVGRYAADDLEKGRPVRDDETVSSLEELSISNSSLNVVTIGTDMSKSAGGSIRRSSIVKATLIRKDGDGLHVTSDKRLGRLKVISVTDKNGNDWEPSTGALNMGSGPSYITVEADEYQEKRLIEYAYGGDVHFSIVPVGIEGE